uniref:TSGP2 n=1 Tax=Ornithodoros kalahariensis TaxID=1580572 RepID=Q8I9U1_ORNKA|nr:TSGP2 [Ornithodoros kalahariensis]
MMLVLATVILSFSASTALADCPTGKPTDAYVAFNEGQGAYILVKSTDLDARDCLKGSATGKKEGNKVPVMMAFKNEGQWVSLPWTFTLDGPKVTATDGQRTLKREVVYDVASHHCHVEKLASGAYEMWMLEAGGLEVDIECCNKKYDELTSGQVVIRPQDKDC